MVWKENLMRWWLNHWDQVMSSCSSDMGQHYTRKWLVTCSVSSHYQNLCWLFIGIVINWVAANDHKVETMSNSPFQSLPVTRKHRTQYKAHWWDTVPTIAVFWNGWCILDALKCQVFHIDLWFPSHLGWTRWNSGRGQHQVMGRGVGRPLCLNSTLPGKR